VGRGWAELSRSGRKNTAAAPGTFFGFGGGQARVYFLREAPASVCWATKHTGGKASSGPTTSTSGTTVDENKLLERITVNPKIFGGKPIIRGRRLAVEHVLGMLAAGDTPEVLLEGYPWLEREDIQACLVYAYRLVGHERIEPLHIESAA
jgi:uncharacterized protein (DUF433 family)